MKITGLRESYYFHTLFPAEQKGAHNHRLFNKGENCKLQLPSLLNNPFNS